MKTPTRIVEVSPKTEAFLSQSFKFLENEERVEKRNAIALLKEAVTKVPTLDKVAQSLMTGLSPEFRLSHWMLWLL